MRDSTATETLGGERDELASSNALLGRAGLAAGDARRARSGPDKQARTSLDPRSPPTGPNRTEQYLHLQLQTAHLERVLALLLADDAAATATDSVSRLSTRLTDSKLPDSNKLMARYEKCTLERERLFVRYKAAVDKLVAAAGQADTDGWYGPVRREWRRNFVWYWGFRLERQTIKTRRAGDDWRQGRDAAKLAGREAHARAKLERGLVERDLKVEEDILQLVILSKGA